MEHQEDIWVAIKQLQDKLDALTIKLAKENWISFTTLMKALGLSQTATYYKLFHTQGVEPDVDFIKVGGKYLINPSVIARMQK